MPAMRATFGVEYLTSGISPEHDYKATLMSLGTEFKFKHNINLVASGAFQEKGIPEGVEFKYDLLLKYNKFRHQYANVGLLMGYAFEKLKLPRSKSVLLLLSITQLRQIKQ